MSKKIAFFCDYFIVGGVEKVLVTICNALVNKGYDILIVWTGYVEDNFMLRQLDSKVKQFDMSSVLNISIGPKPKESFWKRKVWKMKRALIRYKLNDYGKFISDFHSYDYLIDFKNGNSRIDKIKSTKQQKKIVWLHGGTNLLLKSSIFVKNNLLSYDKIICLTKEFKQDFIKLYPNYKDKITEIYNPCDIEYIKSKSKEYNGDIAKYVPYFLCVSRLDNDKDTQTIVDAYTRYYNSGGKCNMVFLGSGCNLSFYQEVIKQKKLENKIFFLGNSKNPYSWMRNSLALILSSKSEGLPTVLIEGQICKTLCVSSNCPNGPKEILEDGQSGVLFDIGNVPELAKIMADIEKDKLDRVNKIAHATNSIYRFDNNTFCYVFEEKFNVK